MRKSLLTGQRDIKLTQLMTLKKLIQIKQTSCINYMANHHIYGRDTLLYIGISTYADNRIKAHLNGIFGYVNNLSVSFGKIEHYNDSLEIPESILIACHKPSYNKEFIHDISPQAKVHKIIIINNGNNEALKTCCTNFGGKLMI